MYKTIIRIDEESHGTICLAEDYKSAIEYLIKEGWLYDEVRVYDEENDEWSPLRVVYGDNWRETIMNEWDAYDFIDAFDGWLYYYEDKVYSRNEVTKND